MPHSASKYLHDMLDRARLIESYTAGKAFEDFEKTNWLQDAVHWNFCIIGEALSQLRHVDEKMAGEFTGYAKIIGMVS